MCGPVACYDRRSEVNGGVRDGGVEGGGGGGGSLPVNYQKLKLCTCIYVSMFSEHFIAWCACTGI